MEHRRFIAHAATLWLSSQLASDHRFSTNRFKIRFWYLILSLKFVTKLLFHVFSEPLRRRQCLFVTASVYRVSKFFMSSRFTSIYLPQFTFTALNHCVFRCFKTEQRRSSLFLVRSTLFTSFFRTLFKGFVFMSTFFFEVNAVLGSCNVHIFKILCTFLLKKFSFSIWGA